MKQGVVYYNYGNRHLLRLCVSIDSLRRIYQGPVTLLYDGSLQLWFIAFLRSKRVRTIALTSPFPGNPLLRKTQLWRFSPYDKTVYLDADTLILQPIDELFEFLQTDAFWVTQFADWLTAEPAIKQRILDWKRCCPDDLIQEALKIGPAINTGVFGWSKGQSSKLFSAWESLAQKGYSAGVNPIFLDEIALQLVLPRNAVRIAGAEWNESVKHPRALNPKIIHFHGRKHCSDLHLSELWKAHYWEMRWSSKRFCVPFGHSFGDRSLASYLEQAQHNDLTVVSAADAQYLPQLEKNLTAWLHFPGLREQAFVIFVNGIKLGDPRIKNLRCHQNVRFVKWNWPGTNHNQRKRMLSAFVFGVALHVKTPYWMKLDADICPRPESKGFLWPDFRSSTITAQAWGYTKMKESSQQKMHWLNQLDAWWGRTPLFSKQFPTDSGIKIYHKRFNSFCSIEKTSFTRRLAKRCGSQLPISSHDTTSWYAATRWNEAIQLLNMSEQLVQ